MKRWYRLDNTGKLYSAVTKKANTCVFRLAAILNENVDPSALGQAAEITIKRFPTMAVKLRKGLFWAYLYENNNPLCMKNQPILVHRLWEPKKTMIICLESCIWTPDYTGMFPRTCRRKGRNGIFKVIGVSILARNWERSSR